MKTQMSVAIKIEIDDPEKDDKDRMSLATEKNCYDDMGVQRKYNIFIQKTNDIHPLNVW